MEFLKGFLPMSGDGVNDFTLTCDNVVVRSVVGGGEDVNGGRVWAFDSSHCLFCAFGGFESVRVVVSVPLLGEFDVGRDAAFVGGDCHVDDLLFNVWVMGLVDEAVKFR